MPITNTSSPQAVQFQKAMIFIDGTNLFERLKSEKLKLKVPISRIVPGFLGGRELVRIYLYTIQEHLAVAEVVHGEYIRTGVKIILGDGIHKSDGRIKEKGVDALLVADLIYHAASRNFNYALIVSTDTDFVHAVKRVEDFGCRTGVVGICAEVPSRLRDAADDCFMLNAESMIAQKLVSPIAANVV